MHFKLLLFHSEVDHLTCSSIIIFLNVNFVFFLRSVQPVPWVGSWPHVCCAVALGTAGLWAELCAPGSVAAGLISAGVTPATDELWG